MQVQVNARSFTAGLTLAGRVPAEVTTSYWTWAGTRPVSWAPVKVAWRGWVSHAADLSTW